MAKSCREEDFDLYKHNLWYQEVKWIALWVVNPHHWLDSDWAWLSGRAIGG